MAEGVLPLYLGKVVTWDTRLVLCGFLPCFFFLPLSLPLTPIPQPHNPSSEDLRRGGERQKQKQSMWAQNVRKQPEKKGE